jgi:hypothetical protein
LFSCHWKVNGPVPVAVTENTAACPAATVWLAGWLAMLGATALVVEDELVAPAQPQSASAIARKNEAPAMDRR